MRRVSQVWHLQLSAAWGRCGRSLFGISPCGRSMPRRAWKLRICSQAWHLQLSVACRRGPRRPFIPCGRSCLAFGSSCLSMFVDAVAHCVPRMLTNVTRLRMYFFIISFFRLLFFLLLYLALLSRALTTLLLLLFRVQNYCEMMNRQSVFP